MGNMEIKREDILHLASLSNLSLTDEEVKSLGKDLQDIIKYISQLDELDTKDVEPTYQVFEMENIWRDDEVVEQGVSREELLALSEKSRDNQIEVPKVL
jgi:aspartyl-tRNA(Asn)/glutamyl-tRNA(Gln) amidotransferase subunit C